MSLIRVVSRGIASSARSITGAGSGVSRTDFTRNRVPEKVDWMGHENRRKRIAAEEACCAAALRELESGKYTFEAPVKRKFNFKAVGIFMAVLAAATGVGYAALLTDRQELPPELVSAVVPRDGHASAGAAGATGVSAGDAAVGRIRSGAAQAEEEARQATQRALAQMPWFQERAQKRAEDYQRVRGENKA